MKKLSDYQGDKAIELWADLLDPMGNILADKKVAEVLQSDASRLQMVQTILKTHNKDAEKILLTIDPTPLNGLNVVTRLMGVLAEIGSDEDARVFFGFAGQVIPANESTGSVTESTEADEK